MSHFAVRHPAMRCSFPAPISARRDNDLLLPLATPPVARRGRRTAARRGPCCVRFRVMVGAIRSRGPSTVVRAADRAHPWRRASRSRLAAVRQLRSSLCSGVERSVRCEWLTRVSGRIHCSASAAEQKLATPGLGSERACAQRRTHCARCETPERAGGPRLQQ